jgi:hypothetical protein
MSARLFAEQERAGYWAGYRGWPPSTVEWCEENYELCSWIAEFWNSFSSFAIIAAGAIGVVLSHRHGQGELRFILAYLAIIGVGIGSVLFHMTLLRPMQMLDEVPMIYAAQVCAAASAPALPSQECDRGAHPPRLIAHRRCYFASWRMIRASASMARGFPPLCACTRCLSRRS